MCIRDRIESLQWAEYPRLLVVRVHTDEGIVGLGETVDKVHCLLYTSDAADERSSVDLGGRRIIKKKIR